jgi:L-galactonate dehydratase
MADKITITGWATRDVRFPTSLDKTGSDAMNAAGDYSAAYCILATDSGYSGHGMVPSLSLFCPLRATYPFLC